MGFNMLRKHIKVEPDRHVLTSILRLGFPFHKPECRSFAATDVIDCLPVFNIAILHLECFDACIMIMRADNKVCFQSLTFPLSHIENKSKPLEKADMFSTRGSTKSAV